MKKYSIDNFNAENFQSRELFILIEFKAAKQ